MPNKPTILMLPSWYPTKENPFAGSFFREQALCLQEKYNFVVLRVIEKNEIWFLFYIKRLFGLERPQFSFVQDDKGLQEYLLFYKKPAYICLAELKYNLRKFLKKEIRQGIGRYELKSVKKRQMKVVNKLKRKNLLPSFDCVYSLTSQDMAPLGKIFSDIYSVPHVTAEHAPFPWPGQLLKDSAAEAIEEADAFLAISSDKVRQVMLQNVKITPHYVWNLCDESKFSVSKEIHDVKTFLIVAANSFYKNLSLFIKTMEELKKIASKDFKIILAGYNANKGYSKNAAELEEAFQNSSINENTSLIEFVSRDDIPYLYNKCDAFVMTSIQEGLPVSAIEASMSGLPVFSTRCGGVEDYVDDTMGRIVSITDYKTLAKHCNDFLNGTITFDSEKIREKAISYFGRKAFVKNVSEVFDNVLENK